MLPSDCQMTFELLPLRVGMVGFQEHDLSPSCQKTLASQGSMVQIIWVKDAVREGFGVDGQSFDLILLDCRTESGNKRAIPDVRKKVGDALILGLVVKADVEHRGLVNGSMDWLVEEHELTEALQWAIRGGWLRKQALIERDQLRRQLEKVSCHEMADAASTVLHNVGNVLNNINVAAHKVHELVSQSSVIVVHQIAELLKDHQENWDHFLTQDSKGKRIPSALVKLGSHLAEEHQIMMQEIQGLVCKMEHVKHIVLSHQAMAHSPGMPEPLSVAELLDQAMELSFQSGDETRIRIQREYQAVTAVVVDRHQLLQILVNLLKNAKQAMELQGGSSHILTARIETSADAQSVILIIRDTGIGIDPDHLVRMFTRGFTTKHNGHGIGLHSSMASIHKMGGSLHVDSKGIGAGASFTLALPAQREGGTTCAHVNG